jgi:hypothetical protein
MIQYITIPAPATGGGFDLTLAQSQTRSVYHLVQQYFQLLLIQQV